MLQMSESVLQRTGLTNKTLSHEKQNNRPAALNHLRYANPDVVLALAPMISHLRSISDCQLSLNAVADSIHKLNETNPGGEFRLVRNWRVGKWSVAVRPTRKDRRSATHAKVTLGARGIQKLGASLARLKGDHFDLRFNQQTAFKNFCIPLQNRLAALGVGRGLMIPNQPDELTFRDKLEELRSILTSAQLSSPTKFQRRQ